MPSDTRRWTIRSLAAVAVVGAIALAAIGAGGIVAWEHSNSNSFCTNACHAVHPEETRTQRISAHSRVNCIECHMGRLPTLQLIALKFEHGLGRWKMFAGYERPLTSSTLPSSRDNCESCHWRETEHQDSIALKKRYATDPGSSETSTRLVLHTDAGVVRETNAPGIHWHIANDVLFVSTDPQRRVIPWVQVRKSDAKTTTYVDATSKVSPDELKRLKPRRMECADCHSRAGHPFSNPEDLIDEAIARGRIDRGLVSAKARAMALLDSASRLSGTPDQLAPQIDKLIAETAPKGDPGDGARLKEQKFAAAMKSILQQNAFTRPELNWKSFPNHAGHKDFPGCFRCHDGKHLNEQGAAIRAQCTLCHDLPQVVREGGKGSVPSTVMAGLSPPPSHDESNFMRDHRTRIDDTCNACHGKLDFGRGGGSFCANPACHGRKYPGLALSAK